MSDSDHVKTSKTIRQVERMAACGLDESEVAYCMNVSPHLIKAQYADEMLMGNASVVAKVGGAMIKSALRGDTNAGRFILQARAKWVIPTKIESDATLTINDKRDVINDIVNRVAAKQLSLKQAQALLKEPVGKPN